MRTPETKQVGARVHRKSGRWVALALLAVACMQCSPLVHAGDLPTDYSAERYEAAWKRSPFTLASVESETPGAETQYVLVAVGGGGNDGAVIVMDRKTQQRIFVTPQPNVQNLRLVAVDGDPDILKVVARITRGGEALTVRFDKGLLVAANQNPVAPNPTGVPIPAVAPQEGAAPQNQTSLPSPVQRTPIATPTPPAQGVRRPVVVPSNPPTSR